MEKRDARMRDITFMSAKNEALVTVHSAIARKFAKKLERDDRVVRYRTDVPLEKLKERLDVQNIRVAYVEEEWQTDFMVYFEDGCVMIYEVVDAESLKRKAVAEKLEVSRRYWKTLNVHDWKIAVVEEDETKW